MKIFKYHGIIMASLLTVVFAAAHGSAESVFLKDGSIVEGALVGNGEDIKLTLPNGATMNLPAGLVLRIVKGDEYRNAVTVTTKDGAHLQGYIVADEKGKVIFRRKLDSPNELEIERDQIVEIKSGLEGTQAEKTAGRIEVTPVNAARYSFIPIQSGSFLVESNGWGIAFCLLKTGGLMLPLSIMLASSGFGQTGDSETSGQTNPLENNEKLRNITFISLGVWALATAVDAVYSYHYVKNRTAPRISSMDLPGDVSVMVAPRMSLGRSTLMTEAFRPDGLDVHVSVRF
jgi:hypothetical protein